MTFYFIFFVSVLLCLVFISFSSVSFPLFPSLYILLHSFHSIYFCFSFPFFLLFSFNIKRRNYCFGTTIYHKSRPFYIFAAKEGQHEEKEGTEGTIPPGPPSRKWHSSRSMFSIVIFSYPFSYLLLPKTPQKHTKTKATAAVSQQYRDTTGSLSSTMKSNGIYEKRGKGQETNTFTPRRYE